MSSKQNTIHQYRIDKRVIRTFIMLLVVCTSLLAYKIYSNQPVPEVDFVVLGDLHVEGEMIAFENLTVGGSSYEWDFGDSTEISTEKAPVHIYEEVGEYTVSLIVDGYYALEQEIAVVEQEKELPKVVRPRIICATSVDVGKPIAFDCKAKNAQSFKWLFGDAKGSTSSSKTAQFIYTRPGYKTVTLIVNNDVNQKAVRKIYVKKRKNKTTDRIIKQSKPRAPIKEEGPILTKIGNKRVEVLPKAAPIIMLTDEEYKELFFQIVAGQEDVSELQKYLCKGAKLIVNGEAMGLAKLVENLKDVEYTIKDYELKKTSSCVTQITFNYKIKRNILNL